jgi:hypothetical protein
MSGEFNRLHVVLGARSIAVEITGGAIKITVDGKVRIDEGRKRTPTWGTKQGNARERAAEKFLAQADALIAPPLSSAQQSYWRARANDMAGFIRSGHESGRVKHRDALLRELIQIVAGTAASNARAKPADPKPLPWFAPSLGLSTWPVTPEELRAAYHKLALERHPDRGGTHAKFVDLQRAHDAAKAALGVR